MAKLSDLLLRVASIALCAVNAMPVSLSPNTDLALLFAQARAVPFSELTTSLPQAITHVALDERSSEYIAFKRDGSFYGRYLADPTRLVQRRDTNASSCANLTLEEAETLPGWDSITQYAENTWGKGSHTVLTNPDDYPGSPALACITDEAVQATFSDPTCQTNNVTTKGDLAGTDGSVAIAVTHGFTASSTFTIETAASIGVSDTFSVNIGIPEIAEVSNDITVATEVTNTQTSSFDASYDGATTVTVTMNAPKGKSCNAITSVKSCTLQATGQIQYLASGWIWFNYDDRTNGHYKWAANIEAVITNEKDRSSYADFRGSVKTTTHANYQGTCS